VRFTFTSTPTLVKILQFLARSKARGYADLLPNYGLAANLGGAALGTDKRRFAYFKHRFRGGPLRQSGGRARWSVHLVRPITRRARVGLA
jgi:hypothetical protein